MDEAAVKLRDVSHPCIVAWVPLNESWAVPDLPDAEAQRAFVQALYYLTKTLDATRLVIGNDGWETVASDLITIHDYDADADRLARRYNNDPKPDHRWNCSTMNGRGTRFWCCRSSAIRIIQSC